MPRARAYRPTRLLALLALGVALLRHRHPLRAHLTSLLASLRRALNAAHIATLVLSHVSADALTYLHPLQPLPPRRTRRARLSQPPPPPSLRRVLRLLSSDDALAVLHNVAGGAARGLARELRPAASRPANACSAAPLLEALASPAGQKVVSNVVSTAVREGVATFVSCQQTRDAAQQPAWPEVVVDALLSDRGRALAVELAASVTRTAIPLVAAAPAAPQQEVGSVRALSPAASPLSKRPPSYRGCDSPVTRQLVMGVMQAQGRSGLVERLALLAIRDKALVRDVVRTVVSEAVRTYLTTTKEISKEGPPKGGGETVPQSLWKALITSAVVDLKRALLERGQLAHTGWVVF